VTGAARLEPALDAAAPFVVGAAILAAAAGSSIQRGLLNAGMPARWVLIALLFAFACVRAAVAREWSFPPAVASAIALFCGLGLVSTAWSVHPRGTLERAVGEIVVVSALGLLAGCIRGRPALRTRLLDGVLLAGAVVALAGFLYWLAEPSRGAIAATVEYPSRYQGIEENPNTAALLLAIAMPLALARALAARNLLGRVGYTLVLAGLAASISASGSRGGLLGGFVGSLAVVALAPARPRLRAGIAVAVVAALVVAAWAMTIPQALPAVAAPGPPTHATRNAEKTLPLSQEIGNPWWTRRAGGYRRSLFNTSVRLRALRGSIHEALGRPLLGFGFGAEQWAFVNRYYAFSSGNPENGYVGMFLQTGFIGLALFLVMLGFCVVPPLVDCLRRWAAGADARLVAALGAAAAGLVMGLSQSFFHGPGGIAYVAFWTALLTAAVGRAGHDAVGEDVTWRT
jgi:O-antigen ligase